MLPSRSSTRPYATDCTMVKGLVRDDLPTQDDHLGSVVPEANQFGLATGEQAGRVGWGEAVGSCS